MKFAKFMATPLGRGIRIVAGLVIVWWGIRMDSTAGNVIAALGVLPILGGVFNVCLIFFLVGVPFRGKDILALKDVNPTA